MYKMPGNSTQLHKTLLTKNLMLAKDYYVTVVYTCEKLTETKRLV